MSPLAKAVDDYLHLRRALGFKLQDTGRALQDFVAFLDGEGAPRITTARALQWAVQPSHAQPSHWARRLAMVRLFAEYRSAGDPKTEVPARGLLPHRYRRTNPYLYRDVEVRRLLAAALQLPSKTGLRGWTYMTVFGLLAVTGLRISEVVALDVADVDLRGALLTIRSTKFGKSRLVAVHPSTQRALQRYARRRDRSHPRVPTPSFFVSQRGTRLTHWAVRHTFVQLSHQIGLRQPADRCGPRLHDFRHYAESRIMPTSATPNRPNPQSTQADRKSASA
jgi:integrase